MTHSIDKSHYEGMRIQPDEFIYANDIPFHEACIIKYACRWQKKGGIEDLLKIKDYVDRLIDLVEDEESLEAITADHDILEAVKDFKEKCRASGFVDLVNF